ncbi:MAG: DNA primase [Defluviitaleaceae bacterium]|nr:DNA primase [Defluviitaleaceae bacterium]
MRYPPEIIEDIRSGNDIVDVVSGYVRLVDKAGRLFGLCPFHREKTPSFSVLRDRQMYHCFGCGASGNVISFVMEAENFAFLDAVRFLADRINYTLPELRDSAEAIRSAAARERMLEVNAASARYFYDTLGTPDGQAARDYLDQRGISEAQRRRFGLGLALGQAKGLLEKLQSLSYTLEDALASGIVLPSKRGTGYYCRFGGRLIFPIIDVRGKVVGFGGRTLDGGEPKYLNSAESATFNKSRNLYGLNLARKAKAREYILVEGYMDVISLHQAGFANSVAALGTAFNTEHAKALKGYADSVVIAFDSDEAGTRAALKAIPFLVGEGLRVRVMSLRGAKDPDEYVKKYGGQVFAEELKKATPHVMFRIELLSTQYDIADIEGKIGFLREAAGVLAQVNSATERDVYVGAIAKLTGIDRASILKEAGTLERDVPDVRAVMPRQRSGIKRGTNDKGVENARKNLVNIAASNGGAAAAIEKALEPGELGDADYERLLLLITEARRKGQAIVPAEIVSMFDELEAQRKVSGVFASTQEPGEPRVIEKCVNDFVRVIKKHNVDEAIRKAGYDSGGAESEAKLRQLFESKRIIDKLYITISDG